MNKWYMVVRHALLIILLVSPTGLFPANSARAANDLGGRSPQAIRSDTRLVGAYFFYWWLEPNDGEVGDPANNMPFHPPALTEGSTCFHADPFCIPYQGGPYNDRAYYNVDSQRWWEWQFRDMAEAELDIAFLASWDGVSLCDPGNPNSGFLTPGKSIRVVKNYLTPALDAIGNPIRIALFDDTFSEHHQWCLDNGYPPDCDNNLDLYPMSLAGRTCGIENWRYFWYKWQQFYDAIPREMWATHNGLPVEQGGRPLILMWHGWFFHDLDYASETMCRLKKAFYQRYGVEPFLLPDDAGQSWSRFPSDLTLDARCSPPEESWYAIDGLSRFGIAFEGTGADIFSNPNNNYTTAYLGPGGDDFAYSGPYGPVPEPPESPGRYRARWWAVAEGGPLGYCNDNRCQDLYYFQSWTEVTNSLPPPNLVVIESWNELKEGTGVSKFTTYVAPDLMSMDPTPPPLYFTQNPHHDSPWSPWFWIFRTRDLAREWKGTQPGEEVIVDDPENAPGWSPGGSELGRWFYGNQFHYAQETNGGSASLSWIPNLPHNGYYDVYAYWPYAQGATQDAPYSIYHALGTALVRVDQSRYWDAGGWAFLGRYPFRQGSLQFQKVVLTNRVDPPQERRVLADAVRFVYRSPWTPPPLQPRSFLAIVFKNVGSQGETPPTPPPITPYPSPAGQPGGELPPPTPAPFAGPDSYPGPTPTPRPTPTPSPTPTPPPPDLIPPQSHVVGLNPFHRLPSFWVFWVADDAGGSGVARVHLQVRDGLNGTWNDWLPYAGGSFAYFSEAQHGHTYYFRSRATDWAGNVEAWPQNPDYDAFTTVDLLPPASQVAPLPPYSRSTFTVSWSGQDSTSGVASYDVQFCTDRCNEPTEGGGAWQDWLTQTTQTSALFTGGEDGRTYHFRSRARDRAGNVEGWPASPDASTVVDALPPTSTVEPLPPYSPVSFTVTWRGEDPLSGLDSFDVQFCTDVCDSEASWVDWLSRTTVLSATFTEGEDGRTYFFRCRARDRVGNEAKWPVEPPAWTTVDASPPASQVETLPKFSPVTFTVTWSGWDDGSGIASYDVQVCPETCLSPGGDCCQDWRVGVTYTAAVFTGSHGQSYAFRSRSRDYLGNLEEYPPEPDAFTWVDGEPPVTWMEAPFSSGDARQVLLRWGGVDKFSGLASYSLFFRDESAEAWQPWLKGITATQALFTGEAGYTYYFCVRGVDLAGNMEDKDCPGPAGAWPVVGEVTWAVPPASHVEPLPPDAPGTSFEVRWSGTPEDVLYQVQVRDVSGGVWTDWLLTKDRSAIFQGQPGHTYAFRCRAQDLQSGVWEAWPWGEDTRTRLPVAEPQSRSFPGGMGPSEGIAAGRVAHGTLPRPV